jgi:hypothetical protein
MAVDEFGREIPTSRGVGGRRSPSPGPYEGSHLYESLPTSRYDRNGAGGGGGDRRDRSSDRVRDEDRPLSRKRKHHRSESPPSSRRGHGGGGGERARNIGGGGIVVANNANIVISGGGATAKAKKPHPSTLYAEDPMLCQFLWKEGSEGKTDEEYDEYRRLYCLNYVRTFFNVHMDDSWFRAMYSPLEKYRGSLQERNRTAREASEFAQEMDKSLANQISAAGVSGPGNPSFFVLKARLGGGIRQSGLVDNSRHHGSSPNKSSYSTLINPVPATHVLALTNQVLPILEVPHFVTEEQLLSALMLHVSSKTVKVLHPSEMVLFSGSPNTDLTRTAYLQAPEEARKEIIQQLSHLERGGATVGAGANGPGTAATHVPRKEDTFVPKTLELLVECSDAYGRMDVDADGKGGEPDDRAGVPSRNATVWVSTQPLHSQVQVLSVALSSRQRIQEDQEAALKLAKLHDRRRGVPPEFRLETLLPRAVPNIVRAGSSDHPSSPQDVEDALDVTIAYLRRVHLFSFYNGCSAASKAADVLNGGHAASTIHLRLANADEILEPTKDAAEGEAPKVDLLVQRLNDSIQQALEEASEWDERQPYVVDKDVDEQAKDIEYQESQVEEGWIEAHSLIDEDGRARCAFHFCRKLFKDISFLKKHLIKKHSEFLRAEMAKCHDSFMMHLWDSQEQRPVPPILVDCGHRFGLRPSPVLGAAVPLAADPEPELWKREEERREQAEREAEARRDRHNNNHHRPENRDMASSLDAPLSDSRGSARGNRERINSSFVDVDDMKEEKVDMAFDTVEIPIQPPKKKKKKKLL